tara:strand:+ start:1354 stop:1494 length:141 start_codon:yes stop_codon:yes gene_type:complete
MDLHKYAKFKEYELEIALIEAKADIEGCRYSKSSVNEHMQHVSEEL